MIERREPQTSLLALLTALLCPYRGLPPSSRAGESAQNDESRGAWIYFETNEPIGRPYAQNTELIRSIASNGVLMKIILIGANGKIGELVQKALAGAGHEIVKVGHKSGDFRVEIENRESV